MDFDDDNKTGSMEIMAPVMSMAGAAILDKAAIDQQIATARAYPRNVTKAQRTLFSLVTLDQETAEECQYALTRGKGDDAKPIIGPSIRFAEIAQVAWGNMRSVSRIIDEGKEFITANAVCHDLETNVATSVDVMRRITNKHGRRFSADMIMTTGNAAVSIALRNAILRVIPKPFWRAGFAEAQRVVMGDVKTLVVRRGQALKLLAGYGVDEARILRKLGKPSMLDVDVEDLLTLRALFNTIKEGETTPEDAFPTGESVDRVAVQGFNPLAGGVSDEGDDESAGSDRGDAAGDPAASGGRVAPTGGASGAGAAGARDQASGGAAAGAAGSIASDKSAQANVAGNQGAQQEPAQPPAETKRRTRRTQAPTAQAEPPADVLKLFQDAVNAAIEAVDLKKLKAASDQFLPMLEKLSAEDYAAAEGIYSAAYERIQAALQPADTQPEQAAAISRGDDFDRQPPDADQANEYLRAQEGEDPHPGADSGTQPPTAAGVAPEIEEILRETQPENASGPDLEFWREVSLALFACKTEAAINEAWDRYADEIGKRPQDIATTLRVIRFQARKRTQK